MCRLSNSGCRIYSTKLYIFVHTCTAVQLRDAQRNENSMPFSDCNKSLIELNASRQQPQANTIGHSPKGGCIKSQQQAYVISHYFKSLCIVPCAMLIKCIRSTLLLSTAKFDSFQTSSCETKEKGKKGGKRKNDMRPCMHEQTMSASLTYDQNTLLEHSRSPCCCASFDSTSKTKEVTKHTSMQKSMSSTT